MARDVVDAGPQLAPRTPAITSNGRIDAMRSGRFRFAAVLGGALALAAAAPAAAQSVAWDSPMLAAPRPDRGAGFYLFEPAGGNLGILGTWRTAGTGNVRFRFGIAGAPNDRIAVLGGGDYSALVRQPTADFPLEVGWVVGLGAGYVRDLLISIPFGASFGMPINAEDLRITPFVTPRVVVDALFGGGERDSRTDLDFSADLGVDVQVGPTWGVRFGITIGNREALAIGLVF